MIRFKNAYLTFSGKRVLDNFSFEIINEGVTCITGPSGCGKTTMLRVIAGLNPLDSGSFESSFKKPAFMFQEDRLLPWLSSLSNVDAVLTESNLENSLTLLKKVGLENEKEMIPSGLSGGMRRRVALARALAYGGDILLLDEPFKGLDAALIGRMSDLIKAQNIPTLVITHSQEEIKLLGGNLIRFEGPPLAVLP